MPERDDNRVRHVTAQEHEALRKRVHDVSDIVHTAMGQQKTDIALLQQEVGRHGDQIDRVEADIRDVERKKTVDHELLRQEIKREGVDARKYAHAIVTEFKQELVAIRKEEKDDRRSETNTAINRAALIVGAVTGTVSILVAVVVAIYK